MRGLSSHALVALLCAPACQGSSSSTAATPARPAIEVRDPAGAVVARVVPGHPCRATVDGVALEIGGRPLVAQHGAHRWTGDDAANGTTLRRDGAAVARIHARQLFDADGIPMLRVMDNGDVVDPTGRIARKVLASPDGGLRITGPRGAATISGLGATADELALAAMLTAPGVEPELRGLAACHYLL